MNIRIADIKDRQKTAHLIALFRVELKKLKGIKAVPNIEQAKDEFDEYMDAQFPIYVAQSKDDEIIGYIVCRIDSSVVWAESIFIANDYRRKGVAALLYKRAEELANELGNETLYNWVHPNNDKMINFLSKMGYNVLNLIEIRKPRDEEKLIRKISVCNHEYDY